ncbi:MAG: enoyl-CoA hydratase/isomerase family protein [Myxococcales bacterium]|nr:enoyl-CoA hydratase/isomerase family protein [Myxococcales bacterium]
MGDYASGVLKVDVRDGVAFTRIDAPPMNLLGPALIGALEAFTRDVAEDDDVRVVVLKSADPDFFIAHGDVEGILTMPEGGPAQIATEPSFVHIAIDRLRTLPKVTIAQVEGFARGGGSEVALSCDMRFAAKGRAVFGQPEIGLGILPGAGGTVRLMRLLGRAHACEVILGGDDFDAVEAERIGWVNRALAPDQIDDFVSRLAFRIARFPAATIAEIKRTLCALEGTLLDELVVEQNAFNRLMAGPEPHPRMRSFIEQGSQTREGEQTLGADLVELTDR